MRQWFTLLVATLLLSTLGQVPVRAETLVDACSEVGDARKDLREVAFTYSASSFSVSATGCGLGSGPSGDWMLVVHLTGLGQEVQVAGVHQDLGKYVAWSGFHVCTPGPCGVGGEDGGVLRPSGTRITGPCVDVGDCDGTPTDLGYASWSQVLPAGAQVPDQVGFWAEVRLPGDGNRLADRVPDQGSATAQRNRAPVPTHLTLTPQAPPTWMPFATQRTDSGSLLTDDGRPVVRRLVDVQGPPRGGVQSATGTDGR